MKKHIIAILSLFAIISCDAQKNKLEDKSVENIEKEIQPKVKYKVNKEYDESGNLIKYDSVYTYYYSNINIDSLKNDSVFDKLNNFFLNQSPLENSIFEQFFKQDSYLDQDFFQEDFFRNSFQNQKNQMEKIIKRMDSLKNQFMIEEYPLIDPKLN